MDYTLAKKLKDAGFPYKTVFEDGELRQYPPTLHEIIEACGYGFRSLSLHSNGKWIAKSGAKSTGGVSKLFAGKSADEAVVKLWVCLNGVSDLVDKS